MGGCLSSSGAGGGGGGDNKPSANVVLLNGDLRQFPIPVTVSEVLKYEASTSSASSPSGFVCNSDGLYFDEYIPSLRPEDELQAGQIYFVLPEKRLKYKLSASDMAALAVKASVALQKTGGSSSSSSSSSRRRYNKNARISPVILDVQPEQKNEKADFYNNFQIQKDGLLKFNKISSNYNNKSSGLGVSRSGSVRKLQRYSSRRAKMAVRSFRLRLSTIYEGSVH